MAWLPPAVTPIVLLLISNVFMTFAWYGHLRFTDRPLWLVVVASWGIAFIEYCFAVPANRWGSTIYSAAELKTMQEVITLVVFATFSVLYLKEPLGWNHALGFFMIAAGALIVIETDTSPRSIPPKSVAMSSTVSIATPSRPTSPSERTWSES